MFQIGREEPIFFTVMARISGDLSLSALQRALTKVRQKHPFTAVKVVDDGETYPNYVLTDPADVPLRIIANGQEDLWKEVVAQELAVLVDATKDPLVRFVWIQGDGFSDLIAVCHHAVADGLSAAYLMHDALCFLGDPDLEVAPLPINPSLENLVPAHVTEKLLPQILPNLEEQMAQGFPKDTPERVVPPLPQYVVHARELTQTETAVLLKEARANETTVHGALGAAFLLAFAQQFGAETGYTRTIQSPINVRPHLAEPLTGSMGTFIHLATTEANCAFDQDFWHIARTIRDGFAAQLTPANLFSFPLMIKQMPVLDHQSFLALYNSAMAARADSAEYDLSLSNIGRLDFAGQYGRFQLESFYGPTFSATVDENVVGVCTVNGRLSFTFIHKPAYLETAVVETLIEHALLTLGNAVGW